jgi:hypothetical protein
LKTAAPANRETIWAFGQSWDFHIVTTDHILGNADFGTDTHQKTQIVLHGTAGNGTAEDVIDNWNGDGRPASAHFAVERAYVPQAARAAGASEQSDAGLVDVVRIVPEDQRSFHGGVINSQSIGIEIVNCAWSWFAARGPNPHHPGAVVSEPTLAGKHVPLNTCPSPINTGGGVMACNHARPADPNHFIRLNPALDGFTDYQSIEDRTYGSLILLLRHLCIRHRIPRQFLGTSRAEIFRHYLDDGTAAQKRVYKNLVYHFRGILAHRNVHPNKVCPGIVNRNRLYRGIIDEWWLPVQLDGQIRPYYTGPFFTPQFAAGTPEAQLHSYFRFRPSARIEGVLYRDAELEPMLDTRSYYNLNDADSYYSQTETRLGGMFPVGVNKVWHGGIHLPVQDANPCVYAAASGTIVAARVMSNKDTNDEPKFGSQGFVLVQHAIYREHQADPGGIGQRIDYTADPRRVFSLYMHLADVHDRANVHDENPPWFNSWRRDHPADDAGMDGDKGRVIAPNVMVSIGDILGTAGTFRGRRMIHFEIISHRNAELTGDPWSAPGKRVEDTDADIMCNVSTLDGFLTDQLGDGLDIIDVLRAAPQLRDVKALHKSEWSLTAESQIEPLVPHPDRRAKLWPHFRRFSWVAEAIAANPTVQQRLGDATGMFWHYHPITFMQHMNKLVAAENREIEESEFHDTNVELDGDDFITNFVGWTAAPAPAGFRPNNADAVAVRPNFITGPINAHDPNQVFSFTRHDISCIQPGAHAPGPTTPQSTKFSLALLELLERVRRDFDNSVEVILSYACDAHQANNALCVMNDAVDMAAHHNGIAVDYRPAHPTPANCRALWNSTVAVIDAVADEYAHLCGTPTQANFPSGCGGVQYHTSPVAVENKLRAHPQQALTNAEAAAFRIHLAFVPAAGAPPAPNVTALPVQLRVTVESIAVLDDQDWFGSGEWTLQATANGQKVGGFSGKDADTGDIINAGWSTEVKIPRGGDLRIDLGGYDDDAIWNDSLGSVSRRFDQNSSPAWGLGRWSATSSNGSFRVTILVESLATEDQ